MKTILTITTATLITCGTIGLIAWPYSPADPSQINRQRADKVMTRDYGSDWIAVLSGCRKTNRVQSKAMSSLYHSALDYHSAK